MSPSNSLYEPKLVDRWTKRYRDFEAEEKVRSLRKARQTSKRATRPLTSGTPEKPKHAA